MEGELQDRFREDGPFAGHSSPVQVVPAGTNGYAIASLVLGILWIYGLGSILALAFGYAARSQIRASERPQGGDGLAIAGIVLGWVGLGGMIYFLVLFAGAVTALTR